MLQGCSRCTCFARSTGWSTSEARGNHEPMANSSFTAFHRALGNIGKCKGEADSRELGGGALSNRCPRAGDASRPRRGTFLLAANERDATKKASRDLFSVLFFMTEGGAHITVRHKRARSWAVWATGLPLRTPGRSVSTPTRKKPVVRAGKNVSPSLLLLLLLFSSKLIATMESVVT